MLPPNPSTLPFAAKTWTMADTRTRMQDITEAAMPLGKIAGMILILGAGLWFCADQHFSLIAAKADLVTLRAEVVKAQVAADAASGLAAQAGARVDRDSAVISTRLAGVESGLVDARAALARIETYLRDRRP